MAYAWQSAIIMSHARLTYWLGMAPVFIRNAIAHESAHTRTLLLDAIARSSRELPWYSYRNGT